MQKSNTYIIVGLNILLLVLALWLKPQFQTNDDIGMIYAFSGTAIFDEPVAVTAFSTKIWGLMMVFLYKVLPEGFEAYTIALFLLLFLSNVVIHIKIFEKLWFKNPFFWFIIIPVLFFITINFYLELQFTMVTGIMCFSGVLLLMLRPDRIDKILGYVLIIFAVILRPSIVPIVLAFLFALYFSASYLIPQFVDSRKKIITRFGIFTLIFGSVYLIDNKIHTEEEKRFIDFNLYRGGIVDFNYEEISSNSLPAHWDKEELFLFKNWFYNDTLLYNNKRDYKINSGGQSSGIIDRVIFSNFTLKPIIIQLINPLFRCIWIFAVLPVLFLRQWQKYLTLFILILFFYVVFYNMISLLLKTPPFRVSFMLFAIGIMLLIYFAVKMPISEPRIYLKLVCSGLIIIYGLWITKLSLTYRLNNILNDRCIEKYNSRILYIRWREYPSEIVDPFNVSTLIHKIKIVSMGAFAIHPSVKNSFGNFKFNNLTADIIGKENIVSFLMPSDSLVWKDFRNAYCMFVNKHYLRRVKFEKLNGVKHCNGYSEYKLIEEVDAKLD